MRAPTVSILFALLAPSALSQVVTGQIVDRQRSPIAATLSVEGTVLEASDDGRFAFEFPPGDVFAVTVSAAGHYSMRHTFSRSELIASRDESGSTAIPDIVLVKRRPGRSLFVFAGDTMMGRRYASPQTGEPVLIREDNIAEDSQQLLANMKPYFELADYASVNLETPIFDTPPGEAAPKFVTFFSPSETLKALSEAGVDYAALGNNHIYDFLDAGLARSLEHMAASGLDYSGAGMTETDALQPHTELLNGSAYDLLSFVGWTGGTLSQSANDDKGGAALGTTDNLIMTSTTSAQRGAAPIIQFHGGLEYVDEPTMTVETKLKQAIDSGASLVIAHHPHVFQGLEVYNGKLIAWSLGNFLFDQYFYAPQASALLYVWMDGDTLHHAELAPIYIKGYVPTPATGPMRRAINQRIATLSARRGTSLSASGGHAMLNLASGEDKTGITLTTVSPNNEGQRVVSLLSIPWDHSIVAVSLPDGCATQSGRHRLGQDLLARGNFDGYETFDSFDRSWLDLDTKIGVTQVDAERGDYALTLSLTPDEIVRTGMRKFLRVYAKGNPMTVTASISATHRTRLTVRLQTRADRQGLADALINGNTIVIGEFILEPGARQPIELDFDSPRVGARSLRILFDAESLKDDPGLLEIDDFALIEWRTPFQAIGKVPSTWRHLASSHLQSLGHRACGRVVQSK